MTSSNKFCCCRNILFCTALGTPPAVDVSRDSGESTVQFCISREVRRGEQRLSRNSERGAVCTIGQPEKVTYLSTDMRNAQAPTVAVDRQSRPRQRQRGSPSFEPVSTVQPRGNIKTNKPWSPEGRKSLLYQKFTMGHFPFFSSKET